MGALSPQNLADLLGAPLVAIVEAEAQAARTTASFIRDVGFVSGKGDDGNGVDDLGTPRLVTFRFRRRNADGTDVESLMQVPLLTLVPIPSLQVAEATIGLSLVITDAPDPKKNRVGMKAIVASPLVKQSIDRGGGSGRLTMDVDVTLRQADLTHGMVGLMSMLTEGTSDTRKGVTG
jgi:hypothetical protein